VRTLNAQFGVRLGAASIYRWLQKYIPQISNKVNELEHQLSDTWQADEVFVKMKDEIEYKDKGNMAFLWNVEDRKTRFLLALKVSRHRDHIGAKQVFREAQNNAHGDFPEKGNHRFSEIV